MWQIYPRVDKLDCRALEIDGGAGPTMQTSRRLLQVNAAELGLVGAAAAAALRGLQLQSLQCQAWHAGHLVVPSDLTATPNAPICSQLPLTSQMLDLSMCRCCHTCGEGPQQPQGPQQASPSHRLC